MVIISPGNSFSLENFKKVVFDRAPVRLSSQVLWRVTTSHKALLSLLQNNSSLSPQSSSLIYGIHTGVGVLQKEKASDGWGLTQREIVASHACGVGEFMENPEVRATIYLRSRMLAQGLSGIKPLTLKKYVSLLSREVLPKVPSQGSVGACGDLIPLAHIAHYFFKRLPRDDFGPRDALALINGTEASLGVGLVSWMRAVSLLEKSLQTAALSLFALEGKTEAFDERLVSVKKHPYSLKTTSKVRYFMGRYKNLGLPQDPYSLRAIPQVMGASWETHEYAGELLKREADSITDNPVIVNPYLVSRISHLGGRRLSSADASRFTLHASRVLHGANFHGIHVALACDLEVWALNLLGLLSERRTGFLVSGKRGLPLMLATSSGKSGLMMAHVASAACVSENKILTHPASSDSISTSADQEDVVPMAMGAALKFKKVLSNASRVIAIEALAAARALRLTKKEDQLRRQTRLYPFFKDLCFLAGEALDREDKPYSDTIEKIARHFLS